MRRGFNSQCESLGAGRDAGRARIRSPCPCSRRFSVGGGFRYRLGHPRGRFPVLDLSTQARDECVVAPSTLIGNLRRSILRWHRIGFRCVATINWRHAQPALNDLES